MKYSKLQTSNQSGFASLVIALVLILVMGLLTIGFAQLARREQQTALNKQLSNQAYYAAESGINDVIKSLPAMIAEEKIHNGAVPKNQCLGSTPYFNYQPNVNSQKGISYSCVLVNLKPDKLVYDNTPSNATRSTTFSTDGPLGSLTVNWSNSSTTPHTHSVSSCSPTPGTCFPATTNWSAPAVIQFSLTKIGPGGSDIKRADLIANTFTAYLYPTTQGPNTVNFDPANNQAPIVGGACTDQGCSVTINGIQGTPSSYYLLRLANIYARNTKIVVGPAVKIGGGDQKLVFIGAQVQVDVTGKAKTVLKRVQVRLSQDPWEVTATGKDFDLPDTVIEASDICKRAGTYPATTDYFDVGGGKTSDTNNACYVN